MDRLGECEIRTKLRGALERIAALEEHVDMLQTPAWKRLIYWLNGWPFRPIAVLPGAQRWRPWHRRWGRADGRRTP